MRKTLLLLTCGAVLAAIVGCKGGDEAPPEQNPYISLLGLNPLSGTVWTGSAQIQTCSDTPVASSCSTLSASEDLARTQFNNALTLIVGLNQNTLNGSLTFVAPQYGVTPVSYTFGVVGTTKDGATSDRVITLTQTSVTPATTPRISIVDFRADQQLDQLTGRMTLDHYQDFSSTSARVLYALTLKKSL
ncbi:MAG: hypothetical protein HY042_11405 [Spirochaetia bacterium]|nr:hypothetical protein [Spirochaetia bacterium]